MALIQNTIGDGLSPELRLIRQRRRRRRMRFGALGYPSIISDGNSVAWYMADDLTTVTKDGADRVSDWADKLGSGNDLVQAVGADQPLWTVNGLLFDGVSEFMNSSFVLVQPEIIYIVFEQKAWASKYIFDGFGSNTGILVQNGVTPDLASYAGILSPDDSGLALNTFGIVRVLFNGAASTLEINELGEWTGDAGANNMSGFNLGSQGGGGGASPSNCCVKEVLVRKTADSAPNQQLIYNYLANKYSI